MRYMYIQKISKDYQIKILIYCVCCIHYQERHQMPKEKKSYLVQILPFGAIALTISEQFPTYHQSRYMWYYWHAPIARRIFPLEYLASEQNFRKAYFYLKL